MWYLLISIIFSAIAIFSSFPIAISHNIPLLDIITIYLAYLMFCACLCGVILVFARYFTKKNFNPNSKLFTIPQWEQEFYKEIKIDKWKSIVPDFGNLVRFKKKIDIKDRRNSKFYERFLYENINASILHFVDILLSPLFFSFIRPEFYVTIGLVGFILVFILNILPVMLQRYLRPRVLKIYNKLKSQEIQCSENLSSSYDIQKVSIK